jgi:hypothetical protein
MGDKEGARVQLDLLLSGKPLEVNAAGRKVRRDRCRDRLTILWTPLAQGKYSLEVCCRVRYHRYRFSCLMTFFCSRTNCTCVPTQRSKRFTSISVSRYCMFLCDLYSLRVVVTLLAGQLYAFCIDSTRLICYEQRYVYHIPPRRLFVFLFSYSFFSFSAI